VFLLRGRLFFTHSTILEDLYSRRVICGVVCAGDICEMTQNPSQKSEGVRGKRFKAGARREEGEYPNESWTDEQRRRRLKDLLPFGLRNGGPLAALLLSHPAAAGRLRSFVAPRQRPAIPQRTPSHF
jgi:hypothetical protein